MTAKYSTALLEEEELIVERVRAGEKENSRSPSNNGHPGPAEHPDPGHPGETEPDGHPGEEEKPDENGHPGKSEHFGIEQGHRADLEQDADGPFLTLVEM